jgi:hypothetical protein
VALFFLYGVLLFICVLSFANKHGMKTQIQGVCNWGMGGSLCFLFFIHMYGKMGRDEKRNKTR